jgi:beta-glucosidase
MAFAINMCSRPTGIVGGASVICMTSLTNTGTRAGVEPPQMYAGIPFSGEPPKRLVAWQKVALAPGESKSVTLNVDAKRLGVTASLRSCDRYLHAPDL